MKKLINELINDGYLKTPEIISAFRKINRADFLYNQNRDKEELEIESEINAPLPLFSGQTISQPLTVAFMLELLQPKKGNRVLDIGSGSGWTACLLSELVGPEGQVIALERIGRLMEFGKQNAQKYNQKNILFMNKDGYKGLPEKAPFNRIHVAAAARQIPDALKKQLDKGGRLVMPIGEGLQDIVCLEKDESGKIREVRYSGFAFVPLISGTE